MLKIKLQTINSGAAGGKQTVVVENFGSFQPTYVELPTLSVMCHLYISHSIKNADIKLCSTLMDVAEHLGIDCDEMVNNLPNGWDKEFSFKFI